MQGYYEKLLEISETIEKIAEGIKQDDDELDDESYENYIRRFAIDIVKQYYITFELDGNLRDDMLKFQKLFDAYYEESVEKDIDLKTLLYHFIEVVGGKRRLSDLQFVFPMWKRVYDDKHIVDG